MTNAIRRDVEFQTCDGLTLKGWFYPAGPKAPCVILTHGWSGVKELYLDNFARHFQSAGFACLVYDNRNFGDSDGHPRFHIDPSLQAEDYHDAVTYLLTMRDEVDGSRIAAWGSSFSGGNVIQAAAFDKRIKVVIAQVPTVAPRHTTASTLHCLQQLQADRSRMILDRRSEQEYAYMPVIARNIEECHPDKSDAFLYTRDAYDFFSQSRELAPLWQNKTTFKSVFRHMKNAPHAYLHKVSPAPFLMVVAENDNVTPTAGQIKAFESAGEPKELHVMKGLGHFDLYYGPGFKENIVLQVKFLRRYL